MQEYSLMVFFFTLYIFTLFLLYSVIHYLIVPAEASDLGDTGGDHTAPPVLRNPDCTSPEGVLY